MILIHAFVILGLAVVLPLAVGGGARWWLAVASLAVLSDNAVVFVLAGLIARRRAERPSVAPSRAGALP